MPATVAAGAGIAAAIDLRTGRIPNPLTGALALTGFSLAGLGLTGQSMAGAAVGGLLGMLLMLPGHVLGGTGAGDLKLLAALGTLLGPAGVLMAFLYGAIAGGLLALVHAWRRGRLGTTLDRTGRLAAARPGARQEIDASAAVSRFAYGPALAAGALVAALV